MALVQLNTNPTPRELRQFGCIWLPAALAVIGWIVWRKFAAPNVAGGLLAVAGLSAATGLIRPTALRGVWIGWMVAVFPIGWTVSHLLLAIIYYLCITPIGLALRVFGVDPLERKFDREADSYWIAREQTRDKSRYFKQF